MKHNHCRILTAFVLAAMLLLGCVAQAFASETTEIEIFTRFADGASKAFFDEVRCRNGNLNISCARMGSRAAL